MTIAFSILLKFGHFFRAHLGGFLSLDQKVRINPFLSRSYEDFLHKLFSFLFQLANFFCVALFLMIFFFVIVRFLFKPVILRQMFDCVLEYSVVAFCHHIQHVCLTFHQGFDYFILFC